MLVCDLIAGDFDMCSYFLDSGLQVMRWTMVVMRNFLAWWYWVMDVGHGY